MMLVSRLKLEAGKIVCCDESPHAGDMLGISMRMVVMDLGERASRFANQQTIPFSCFSLNHIPYSAFFTPLPYSKRRNSTRKTS
jgi:hypothetical protein